MAKKLKVLFVSAECEPYARTGGLGDVSAALPLALCGEGVDVIRVMPLHRQVKCSLKYKADFSIPMGDGFQSCIIKYDSGKIDVPTYFIANDWYFNREKLYGYYEDGERYLFFCKAVVEMLKHISFKPDIVHCNDWHTGFIPLLLKNSGMDIKTVYTIHSLKYTGCINEAFLRDYHIPEESLKMIGSSESLNFTRAAIFYSDFLTTVSREYAREITTSEYGEGYEALLMQRKGCLKGILNGIDIDLFSPEDALFPFNALNLDGKRENKKVLREELGLDDSDMPIVSAVTRLDYQKGIDILLSALRKTDLKGFQFVLLGTGNKYFEDAFYEMASMYPGRMAVRFAFDTELSKRIYAGSDIFVMPSRFEPGGLGQLYAMNYGTVPVVRSTGGLMDTVKDLDSGEDGNGFCFKAYSVNGFIKALNRAIAAYNKPGWEKLMKNGMKFDKSWKKSVIEYIDVYNRLILSQGDSPSDSF